ncbi:MAG: flagellar biosynthesis protein FlhF [Peptococcaceae bacterium]|jgi:flagellar biosynthesis protein FlhF|nr:flagellar biosynthesis protein FlhF [Peptococcaceae bacterium]
MRVKRFVAASMQEAMAKIKVEMGNDAVILHTRSFKEGGFLGLFAKKYVEITAAVDQAGPAGAGQARPGPEGAGPANPAASPANSGPAGAGPAGAGSLKAKPLRSVPANPANSANPVNSANPGSGKSGAARYVPAGAASANPANPANPVNSANPANAGSVRSGAARYAAAGSASATPGAFRSVPAQSGPARQNPAPAAARVLPKEEPVLARRILTPKAYAAEAAQIPEPEETYDSPGYLPQEPDFPAEDFQGSDFQAGGFQAGRGSAGGFPSEGFPSDGGPAEDFPADTRDKASDTRLTAEMAGIIAAPAPQSPVEEQTVYQRLVRQGVEEKLAQGVIRSALKQAALIADPTDEDLEELVLNQLLKQIKRIRPSKKQKTRKAQVLAFIGPTGVGKTTTIAKLAGLCAMVEQKNVALVTVDTYRIAAVEQLKTIGEIMNVPVEVVFTPEEMRDCLGGLDDRDLIFLDTAGRSHKNVRQIEELSSFLEQAQADEVYLVLSGTSKTEDLFDMAQNFKSMRVTALILTKLDETSFFGSIFNVACKSKLPIAYFTTGQSIPDDIEQADPVKLAQMLLKP